MKFVVSMTDRIGTLRQIVDLWDEFGDERNPFAQTIFTPLFAKPEVMKLMQDEIQHCGEVFFDSGGYYVQQGLTNFESLYQDLMKFYRENRWGSWYVLPDYVPTSSLSLAEVEERVQATVTVSKLFFDEMPEMLRARAMPVVQGHTFEQIQFCIEQYAEMGVSYVGFGSFGTSGENHDINTITRRSIQMIEFLRHQTQKYKMKIHAFGIGTPGVLSTFYQLGVDSFDSSGWSRTAGFGNVFMPFIGRRNISGRMLKEIGGQAYTPAEFAELKALTGHKCPFCEDISILKEGRIYQMMHNLCVMLDTVDALNRGETANIMNSQSTRYERFLTQLSYTPLQIKNE